MRTFRWFFILFIRCVIKASFYLTTLSALDAVPSALPKTVKMRARIFTRQAILLQHIGCHSWAGSRPGLQLRRNVLTLNGYYYMRSISGREMQMRGVESFPTENSKRELSVVWKRLGLNALRDFVAYCNHFRRKERPGAEKKVV
jgi:hypothetical protein